LSIQHNPLYAVDADVVKGYKTLELHLNEADNYFITSLFLWPPNIAILKEGRFWGIDRPIDDYLNYLITGGFSWMYEVIYFCYDDYAIQNYEDLGINLTDLVDYYFNLSHPNTMISPFYLGSHLTIWNVSAIK
ncbi:MAG: hypothetical protein ACTSQI_16310, partial [Candidatus Helarchaeota archaeon]